MRDSIQLNVKPRVALWFLLGCVGVLVVLHVVSLLPVILAGRDYSIVYFDITKEMNLPTLFSSCQLIAAGLLCFVIGLAERLRGGKFSFWFFLFAAFVWVGIDETIMIHEYISDHLHERFETSGAFRFAWVIPYGAALIVILAVGARFFFRLPAVTKKQVARAAIVFVSGGIGMEMLQSAWYDSHGFDAVYNVMNGLEEILEMVGVSLFVYAFLDHLDREHSGLALTVSSRA